MHPDLVSLLHDGSAVSRAEVLRWHTPHDLRALVDAGELVRVWQGVYCAEGPAPSLRTRLKGLDVALGRPVTACSHTAAELLGFAVDPSPDVHVVAPTPRALAERPGVRVHRGAPGPVEVVDGRRCTTPAWTAVAVAATQRRPRALATLDAVLRSGRSCSDELALTLDARRGARGVARLRPLLALADGLAESPMESETRLLLHDAGLPAPVLQHDLRDPSGRFVARFDLAWPWARLAVEYDGVEFHSDRTSLQRDRLRAGSVLVQGWRCLSLTASDIRETPSRTTTRIARLLAERAAA